MLKKKMIDALNKQMANEAAAAQSYLAMAAWCAKEGLQGCTQFFLAQSAEEREHMLKFFDYLSRTASEVRITEVAAPKTDYSDLKAVFEQALKQEQGVTANINALLDLSRDLKDYATEHFLQWFVEEQLEEEDLFRRCLDVIRLGQKSSLLLIDREIPRLREAE